MLSVSSPKSSDSYTSTMWPKHSTGWTRRLQEGLGLCPYNSKLECDCFQAIKGLDFADTSTYVDYLDDESVMTYYLSGKWSGQAGIIEYMNAYGGPFVSELQLVIEPVADFSQSTEGMCVGVFSAVTRVYSKAPPETPLCADFTGGNIIRYEMTGNSEQPALIKEWDIWTDKQFVSDLFTVLNEPGTAEFVCDVILNTCDGYSLDGNFTAPKTNQTMEECLEEFSTLPSHENGYIDGNSAGCRILHSSYGKENPDHCPHLTFEKQIDRNGFYKCYKSKQLQPEDMYTGQELAFMKSMTLPYESENPYFAAFPAAECPDVSSWKAATSVDMFAYLFGMILVSIALVFCMYVLYVEWTIVHKQQEDDSTDDHGSSAGYDSDLHAPPVVDTDDTEEVPATFHGKMKKTASEFMFKKTWGSASSLNPSSSSQGESYIMSWKGLSCSYPSKNQNTEQIFGLSDATGAIQASELVAIMGPSGAGKTTLLDILSGRKSVGTLKGDFSILGRMNHDGHDLKHHVAESLQHVSAYVPQQEEFFPMQTPYEAVVFSATMRLGPKAVTDEQVFAMLDQMHLKKSTWHRPIGGTQAGGVVVRGLSGGERKRLALACALALKPSILFLDEITSGLDSENSLLVTQVLKKMCTHLNVTAIMIVHQPGLEMFELFDRLILMSHRGTSLYSGKVAQLEEFYKNRLGKNMPEKHLVPNNLLHEAGLTEESITNDFVMPETQAQAASEHNHEGRKDSPSLFFRFKSILLRNLTNHYLRNLTNLTARIFIYMLTALVTGLIFWNIGSVVDGVTGDNLPVLDLYSVIGAGLFLEQTAFMLPIVQVSTFFFDKKVYSAEKSLDLYPSWMYALTQFVLETWVLSIATALQAVLAIPMIGLVNPELEKVESFFQLLSFFLSSGLTGNGVVLFFSMITFSQDLALLFSAAYSVCAFAASGAYVFFDNMEPWIRWLQWISPMKYSLQMFLMCLFNGNPTLESSIELLGFDSPDSISANLGVLVAMYLILSGSTVLLLSIQKETR